MKALMQWMKNERGSNSVELVGISIVVIFFTALLAEGLYIGSAVGATQQAARDAARAQMLGQSASMAAQESTPDWLRIVNLSTGVSVPGCLGTCAEVTTSVPVGLPSLTFAHTQITQRAIFPKEPR